MNKQLKIKKKLMRIIVIIMAIWLTIIIIKIYAIKNEKWGLIAFRLVQQFKNY